MTRSGQSSYHLSIVLVVTGLSLAALVGALMKLLAETLSPVQITWFRFAGYALLLLPVVWFRFGRSCLEAGSRGFQLLRGFTLAMATVAFVSGARTVDYADAIAILYAYPFLLICLAMVFLKERVDWLSWVGVIGGFAGVLLVMQPGFDEVNTGAWLVFLCAVLVSIQMALNRKLGVTVNPLVTSLWGAVIATFLLLPFLPGVWTAPTAEAWWLLAVLIVLGAVSQTLIVFAFSRAQASALAPFTYFEIVAAVLLGLFIFGTLPEVTGWLGIGLIGCCGVLLARRSIRQS